MTVMHFMRLMFDTLDDPEKARNALDDFFLRHLLAGDMDVTTFRQCEESVQELYAEYDRLLIGGED